VDDPAISNQATSGHTRGAVRVLLVILGFAGSGCWIDSTTRIPNDGVLDLTSWDFDRSGAVALEGGWAFYWGRLADGTHPLDGVPDAYLRPRMWNSDGAYPAFGYATFQLVVRLASAPQQLMLLTSQTDRACRVVVLDAEHRTLARFASGTVGDRPDRTRELLRPGELAFDAAGEITLIMSVSNFSSARGGPWAAPLLGRRASLERQAHGRRYIELVVVGMLLMIALHYFVIFALRRSERATLWFGLSCLSLAVRALVLARYIEEFFPATPRGGLLLRIEYMSLATSVAPFAWFLFSLFPRYVPRWFALLYTAGSAVLFGLALAAPSLIVTSTNLPFSIFALVGLVLVVTWVARGALRDKTALAGSVVLALLVFGVAAIHDALSAQQLLPEHSVLHYGSVAFVLVLSTALAVLNQQARHGLENASRQLDLQNREMAQLNGELRAQIGTRSRLLAQTLATISVPRTAIVEPSTGQLIGGRYVVVRRLGAGGMGRVFAATRVADQRPVAIKLIHPSDSMSPTALARLAREAESAAAIDHPNVVRVLDIDIDSQGVLFLAMELVAGRSLQDERHRFGDPPWALPLLPQIAVALAAIHAGGVIHRDLKPSNILLADGTIKVVDFGIAHSFEHSVSQHATTKRIAVAGGRAPVDSALTQSGTILGSPAYMAPELASGMERSSPAADIYSFGVVAYEMLSAMSPHDVPPVIAINAGLDPQPATPLARRCMALDPSLGALVDRCLGPASERPTARDLVAALRRL
jgi:serine/threonine-protein kinase